MTGTHYKIKEIAGRIRELREITGLTVEEMAVRTGVSVAEYIACESGTVPLPPLQLGLPHSFTCLVNECF